MYKGYGAYPSDGMNDGINTHFNESDTNFFADNSNDTFFCDSFYDSSDMGEFFTEAGIGTDTKEKNFADDKYYADIVDKIDHTPGVTPGFEDYADSMKEHDDAVLHAQDKAFKNYDDSDAYSSNRRLAMAHNDRATELRERATHQFHTPRHDKRNTTGSRSWNPGSEELEDKALDTFRKADAHGRASKHARDEDSAKAHADTARKLFRSGVDTKGSAAIARKHEDDIMNFGGNKK